MGNNLKEKLIFSAMMTFSMVLIMVSYNIVLTLGFNYTALVAIVTNLVPIFIIAFAVEMLVVSHNVKKLHKIIVSPNNPKFKDIIVMAGLMVIGMCLLMSLYATVINHGTGTSFFGNYINALGFNLPVALAAQLLVVGPLVREVHMQIFKGSKLAA